MDYMKKITNLGFEKYRNIECDTRIFFENSTGINLSDCFWNFIQHRQINKNIFCYLFIDSISHEEWEGQVQDWILNNLEDLKSLPSMVIQQSDKLFLPIASDAGGNYVYIEISKESQPIVDVSYSSGAISEIASSLESFLEKIYLDDE
jgi:hypothetical protein